MCFLLFGVSLLMRVPFACVVCRSGEAAFALSLCSVADLLIAPLRRGTPSVVLSQAIACNASGHNQTLANPNHGHRRDSAHARSP